MEKTITLNEQQVERLKEWFLIDLRDAEEAGAKTSAEIIKQILDKLNEE
jgi:hypothetical protein